MCIKYQICEILSYGIRTVAQSAKSQMTALITDRTPAPGHPKPQN